MTELEQNVKKVLSTVNGRATVLAATKTVAPERINLIYDMGIHTIGENRVQELLEKYDALDRDGVSKSFTREEVANVLEPRVEEIAEAIHDAVKGSGVRLGNWSVAYLTGGGLAINRGGRDFLSAKLDRPVRELPRKTGKLSSPVYTSVLGLLDLIIDTLVNANANRGVRAFFNNLFGG